MYSKFVSRNTNTCNIDDMKKYIPKTKPTSQFKKGNVIKGKNRMNKYNYVLDAEPARTAKQLRTKYTLKSGAERWFEPHLHPRQILQLGAFEGKMMNDCMDEFPREWFSTAIKKKRFNPSQPDIDCNLYKIKSRQSLKEWKHKKWIYGDDERGWFQWFCRYAMGRRQPDIDIKQMKRWAAIARWRGTFEKDKSRKIIQQTLLQWSWPHT